MNTVLFAGGGTLGHIIPAVAVARELQRMHPNVQLHFVCSPRGEKEFLQKENIPHTVLDAPRLGWNFAWKFLGAYRQSRSLLREIKPNVMFSKGGYVSVPICLAAKRMGVPIVLHESDAVSGYANRVVARWANTICLGFPDDPVRVSTRASSLEPHGAHKELCAGCFVHTGNPVRPEVTQGNRSEGLRITGFTGDRPILLIIGGSQGAQAINEWVGRNLEALTKSCDVIHITGPGKILSSKFIVPRTQNQEPRTYFSLEFAREELPHLYSITDLAISRAGAGAIAELAACGIATVLVPLRGVAHNHQDHNARSLERRGAAVLVTQNSLDKELLNVVLQLLQNSAERSRLAQGISALHTASSTRQIAEIVSDYLD